MSKLNSIDEGSDSESQMSSEPSSSIMSGESDSLSSDEPEDDFSSAPSDSDVDSSIFDDDADFDENESISDDNTDPTNTSLSESEPDQPKKTMGKSLADRLKGKNAKGNKQNDSNKKKKDTSEITLESEFSALALGLDKPQNSKKKENKDKNAKNDTKDLQPRSALKAPVPKQEDANKKKNKQLSFAEIPVAKAVVPMPAASSSSTIGYKLVKGRYGDDPFETVGLKVDAEKFTLSVFIALMDEDKPVFCSYELGESSMAVDPSDPKRLFFRTLDSLITFEGQFPADIEIILSSMPAGIITHDAKYVTSDSLSQAPKGRPQFNLLGTSRDREFAPPGEDGDGENTDGIAGYDRLTLVETHIRKPQLSIRRMRQICNWVNSLKVWKHHVDISTLHASVCNGIMLARIVEKVIPGTKFMHLNEKALSRRAAMDNLEKSLGQIWRSKCVNNSRIPTARDIFDGNIHKIGTMMQEIFEVYVQRPLHKNAIRVLKWYNNILKQYGRRLPIGVFTESDFNAVWSHFQSGTALFCILYHLYGPTTVGSGKNVVKIDPIRMVNMPANLSEYRTNLMYVFSLLHALEIDVLWDVMDWVSYPDVDFVLLQLTAIYEKLKMRQCSLPPAQGMNAGVTSGPHGLMVVGMVFSDTVITGKTGEIPAGEMESAMRRNRSVLLGSGTEAIDMLPIHQDGDRKGKAIDKRFHTSHLPAGLMSADSTLKHAEIKVKSKRAASERSAWMSTVDHTDDPLNVFLTEQVSVLKKVNQSAADVVKPTAARTLPSADASGIDAAIQSLESITQQNRANLDVREDELADKYQALEKRVQMGLLSPEQYELNFLELERERISLEDDRAKCEEIYLLRRDSIKSQREEARIRDEADDDSIQVPTSSRQKLASSMRSSAGVGLGPSFNNSPLKHKKLSDEERTKLEASWISLHGRAKQTLNSKIKSLTDQQYESQQVHWTDKGAVRSKTGGTHLLGASARTNRPADVWRDFKEKLAERTRIFYESKERKSAHLQTLLQPVRKAAAVSKVPVAMGLAQQKLSFLNDNSDASEYPRQKEMSMMEAEDDFRRRYLAAVADDKDLMEKQEQQKAAAIAAAEAEQHKPIPFIADGIAYNAEGGRLDKMGKIREIDACLKTLSLPRTLGLWDRNIRREYTWMVKRMLDSGAPADHRLEWIENGGSGGGFVSISDIVSMTYLSNDEETMLLLELGEDPRMLLDSGGRTELYVGFSAPEDCEFFGRALKRLYDAST